LAYCKYVKSDVAKDIEAVRDDYFEQVILGRDQIKKDKELEENVSSDSKTEKEVSETIDNGENGTEESSVDAKDEKSVA